MQSQILNIRQGKKQFDYSSVRAPDGSVQGRRHEVLLFGGGGDEFMGIQTHLPQKFIFSSDFGHLILSMLDYSFIIRVKTKVAEIS